MSGRPYMQLPNMSFTLQLFIMFTAADAKSGPAEQGVGWVGLSGLVPEVFEIFITFSMFLRKKMKI